ncbi:TPA: hypothetical protein OCE99_004999 [Escherichia coli]|uniref:hypothetical protein n=1 Tax=Escherichia coli TaxID=562 RepID=UPI0032B45C2D|nr:hypothetical protein [Escherichia coli]HCO8853732.1 hypothetical protein [Escherichia coli]HCO8857980.1 hypothetical protein [Escherichia coli]HCO8931334.1 hypothetical protein [Escherichia coli]HCO9239382.1 hypothetical protein [Escherichia coli]
MDKIIFRSESDRENAKASDTEAIWYTVVNELKQSEQMASTNPWNQDDAIIKKRFCLLDDCVISIRSARAEDRIEKRDYNKGYYFIKIMNQDESIKFSSHKIYSWEQVIECASWFKGVSFLAAQRIWKVKKL